MMKRQFLTIIFLFAVVSLFFVQPLSGAEMIGELSDPCNLSIDGCIDIIAAKVDKSGSQLTFYMTTRSPIPASVPDPCNITYIWFVDADNNSQTGQNPGGNVGSEFNVRAVIKPTVEGWVDVTGALPFGGGPGTVTINGNELTITIDMPQIASPDLFHFRCDAAIWDGSQVSSNGMTAESAEAWVSEYAVLYDWSYRYHGIDQNCVVLQCDESDPFNIETATVDEHETWTNEGQPEPQFNMIMVNGIHDWVIESLSSADFLHLRTVTYLGVIEAVTGTFGYCQSKITSGGGFSLLSREGQSGYVPDGRFILNIRHDYHLRAWCDTSGAEADTYAQIVITDITDPENIVQKLLWPVGRNAYMNKLSSVKTESIDLADKDMEFDRSYVLDVLLLDNSRLRQPVMNGQSATDSSLIVSIDTALPGDLDKSRFVDFADFAMFAENWLKEK